MKKITDILKWFLISLFLLLIVVFLIYFLGPRPKMEAFDNIPLDELTDLPTADQHKNLKLNNEARIVWADSSKQKTEYSLVYLHGFSASPMEADPLHIDLAKKYGFNLYLARLDQHGLNDPDAFLKLSPKSMVESAKKAVAIGKKLGQKVILMSCSTGGSLALYLSAKDSSITANILMSPNIKLADPNSFLLSGPWGLEIAKTVVGDFRSWTPENDSIKQYWNSKYRIEGVIALQQLLNATMKKEIFRQIKQPVFMGYYYKNEKEQDQTVSVKAMLEMFKELGTESSFKRKIAFEKVNSHVICSKWTSKDLPSVEIAVTDFIENVLKIKAKIL
jgi:pimeloyl-ACP methyl ester carboxylesterase